MGAIRPLQGGGDRARGVIHRAGRRRMQAIEHMGYMGVRRAEETTTAADRADERGRKRGS
jgi:hypothetical protein